MKNFMILVLLFFSVTLMAQEKEYTPEKGKLYKSEVVPVPFHYDKVTTVYRAEAKGTSWKMDKWSPSTTANVLFSTKNYADNDNNLLAGPEIQLPHLTQKGDRLNLYLKEYYQLESYYDEGVVQVSTDQGKTWDVVSSRSGESDARTTIINLSAYAGQSIRLGFLLKADASHHFEGWTVQDLYIQQDRLPIVASQSVRATFEGKSTQGAFGAAKRLANLNGTLTGLDDQKFPRFIFATFKVNDGATPLLNLTEAEVSVCETIKDSVDIVKNVVKDDTYKLFSSGNNTSARPVDIVFLMDNSGSMGDEQAAVAANLSDFVTDLDSRGLDYRLGLCRFGQSANGGNPIFHNSAAFYSDPTEFINVWNTINTVNGGFEPSWDAMVFSTQQYFFRAGAQKIFIHITDEDMTGNNLNGSVNQDKDVVINTLAAAGISLYTLTNDGNASFQTNFGDIARATGGEIFNILDPFNDILDDIGTSIDNTYTLRYTPTSPKFDGLLREVDIKIDVNGMNLVLEGDYRPGAAPVVVRTDATLALSDKGQDEKTAITISANAIDRLAPYTTGLTLFYRKSGTSDTYKQLAMGKSGTGTVTSLWTAIIPDNDVLPPGMEYYIRATDGQSTITAPEFIDQPGYPWSFAVLPNQPPEVRNLTNVVNLKIGDPINFEVEAIDNTNNVAQVFVNVRTIDDINFVQYPMIPAGGNLYTLNTLLLKQSITEYYFQATDDFGVTSFDGTELNPYTLTSDSPFPTTTPLFSHTINLAGIDFTIGGFFSVAAKIGNDPLAVGDVIVAFYEDAGVERIAGSYTWLSQPSGFGSFIVSGDDPGTPEKEGYATGESFIFKLFKKDEEKLYDFEATYLPSSPNTTYADGGSTNVGALQAYYQQAISVRNGLNLWSTYLAPKDPSISVMMANESNVQFLTDINRDRWFPTGTGTLTTHTTGYGYELGAAIDDVIEVEGSKLDLTQLTLSLNANPQRTLIGCPYEAPENVEAVFANYTSSVFSVDRYVNDGAGGIIIETYSPMFDLNQWSNKNMEPGQAYYVSASVAEPNFMYPAPAGPFSRRANRVSKVQHPIQQKIQSIDHYMNLMLPLEAWETVPKVGSEVHAFHQDGTVLGSASVLESGVLLTLDGATIQEGEVFELRLKEEGKESVVLIDRWSQGDGTYHNLRFAVAAGVETLVSDSWESRVLAYPNPAKEELTVRFELEKEANISLQLTDLQGRSVQPSMNKNFVKGAAQLKINTSSLGQGIYLLQVQKGTEISVKKILINELR